MQQQQTIICMFGSTMDAADVNRTAPSRPINQADATRRLPGLGEVEWWLDLGGGETEGECRRFFGPRARTCPEFTPLKPYISPPSAGGASASKSKPWKAQLHFTEDGKRRGIHIAIFAREQDAARAFDRVSIAKLRHAEATLANLQVEVWWSFSTESSIRARGLIPRAAVGAQPPQDL